MIDEIANLTEDQFLDLLLEIYGMGYEDSTHDNFDSIGQRLWRIRTRVEEWLEI